jgi:hypothetical protein
LFPWEELKKSFRACARAPAFAKATACKRTKGTTEGKSMKITVIGAGIMGSRIAHASAVAGYDTSLYDVSKEVLEKVSQLIEAFLDTGVKRQARC